MTQTIQTTLKRPADVAPDILQLDIDVHKAKSLFQMSVDRNRSSKVITANRSAFQLAVSRYVWASGGGWVERVNTQDIEEIDSRLRNHYASTQGLYRHFYYHTYGEVLSV